MDTKTTAILYAALSTISLIAVCFLAYIKVLPADIVYVLLAGLVGHSIGTVSTAIQFPETGAGAAPTPTPTPTPTSPARSAQTQVPQTQNNIDRAFSYPPTAAQQWSNAQVQQPRTYTPEELAQFNRQIIASQATISVPAQPIIYPSFQQQQQKAV